MTFVLWLLVLAVGSLHNVALGLEKGGGGCWGDQLPSACCADGLSSNALLERSGSRVRFPLAVRSAGGDDGCQWHLLSLTCNIEQGIGNGVLLILLVILMLLFPRLLSGVVVRCPLIFVCLPLIPFSWAEDDSDEMQLARAMFSTHVSTNDGCEPTPAFGCEGKVYIHNERLFVKERSSFIHSSPLFWLCQHLSLSKGKLTTPDVGFWLRTTDVGGSRSGCGAPSVGLSRHVKEKGVYPLPVQPFHVPAYFDNFDAVFSKAPPWEETTPKAFFRGSTHGLHSLHRWRDNPRVRLVALGKKHKEVDALFDRCALMTPAVVCRELRSEGMLDENSFVPFSEALIHRYLITAPGTGFMERTRPFMMSGRVVMRIQEESSDEFNGVMEPWKHFVPIAKDASDLVAKVLWAIEHDDEARDIGKQGQSLARRSLQRQTQYTYINHVLKRLGEERSCPHHREPSPKVLDPTFSFCLVGRCTRPHIETVEHLKKNTLQSACPGSTLISRFAAELSPPEDGWVLVDVGANKGWAIFEWLQEFGLAKPHGLTSARWKEILVHKGVPSHLVCGPCGSLKIQECPSDVEGIETVRDVNIFGFEPLGLNHHILQTMVDRFNLSEHVHIERAAFSGSVGVGHFPVAKESIAGDEGSSLSMSATTTTEEVPITTIRELVKKIPQGQIDFLMIDTEGYDPLVLKGAKDVFETFKVRLVVFEHHGIGPWKGYSLLSVLKGLKHYDCFFLIEDHTIPLSGIDCWHPGYEIRNWSNVACASPLDSKLRAILWNMTLPTMTYELTDRPIPCTEFCQ